MAELGLARAVIWQAWALSALLATVVPAVRLALPRRSAAAQEERTAATPPRRIARTVEGVPAVASSVRPTDDVLSRLAVAETAAERCELLDRVEKSSEPRGTYAIAGVLDHTHLDSVRACATRALAEEPNLEAQSWLVDLSTDPVAAVRDAALSGLAERDDPAARAVVIEATHAESAELRLSAANALLRAGRAEGFNAALSLLPELEDRNALSELIEALGQSHAAQALPVLESVLSDSDRDNHLRAIAALGDLDFPGATERLVSLLELGSGLEFRAAANALLKQNPKQALAQLGRVLASSDDDRSMVALRALAGSNLPEVMPMLQRQLHSGDDERAAIVLQRLARHPAAEFETELGAFAASEQPGLKRLATNALEKLDTPSARAILQRVAAQHPELRSLVVLAQDESDAAQGELLQGVTDPKRNAGMLDRVVELAPASTLERIVERVDQLGSDAKRDLIQGLAERGDPRFSGALRAALNDAEPGTRHGALHGLLQLGDQAALADAERLAQASDPDDRNAAIELLATRLDAKAEGELSALAADRNVEVASNALHVVQGRAPERALALAMRAFREASAEDRSTLLANLSDLEPNISRPLCELALREGDDDAVTQAVHSLTALEGPESAQRLADVMGDANRSQEVRSEAAAGLRSLGGPVARASRAQLDALSEPPRFRCDIPE